MQIRIGAPVLAEDGRAGRVEKIILHPSTNELVGIVAAHGWLPHEVVIPAERLLGADEHGVRVRGTVEEIANLEPFALSQYVEPPEDWIPPTDLDPAAGLYLFPASPYAVGAFEGPATQPPPPAHEFEDLGEGDIEVSRVRPVYCRDGEAGRVKRLVTEGASGRVSHLVVERGGLLRREVLVPIQYVVEIGHDAVRLSLSCEELDRLPAAPPQKE